ncbi:MAG: LytTR family transcriptional regulator [Clostridia bacterium]|nr:LytTR family transcriptional regulator [Clostridia bacterium]
MKCTIVIDRTREEEVVIYAHQKSALTEGIEALVESNATEIVGYDDNSIVTLTPSDVNCFIVEGGKVFALTDSGKWQLRQRLYAVEESLGQDFVKINQSCVANIRKIDRFEASLGGSLLVLFKNGYRDYVSRRQLKTVKERIGFRL